MENDPKAQLDSIAARLNAEPTRRLVMTRRFNASPERVFDAWVKPEIAGKWLFHGGPDAESATHILPAKVDAQWTVISTRAGITYRANGFYLEVDRPRRLVFTFGMPEMDALAYDRIIVEFTPDGDGCLMTFTQEGLAESDRAPLEHGWGLMFDYGLKAAVETAA